MMAAQGAWSSNGDGAGEAMDGFWYCVMALGGDGGCDACEEESLGEGDPSGGKAL